MTFVVILLILVLIWMIFGDRISAWFRRRMMESVEDRIRQSMGMPSRKEQRRREQEAAKRQRRNDGKFHRPDSNNASYGRSNSNPYQEAPHSILPKEYAEDVEYTEYKEFSSTTTVTSETKSDGSTTTRVVIEEQVTDVEFVEIKES